MTGYGSGEALGPRGKVRAEVRGINARFLEVRVRAPQSLAPYEADFRRKLSEAFSRGRLDLTLGWEPSEHVEAAVRVNAAIAKAYLEGAIALRASLGVEGELALSDLLELPGVIETTRSDAADPELRDTALTAIDAAVKEAAAMRRAEGADTARDLQGRLAKLATHRDAVAGRAGDVPAQVQKRIQERLARLGVEAGLDPGKLAQEVAYLADRADIAEELARLSAHIGRFRDTLAREGEAIGKTLEFLSQELHRETNTIGSKSGDLDISGSVLEMKTEIERMREQVLNLE